jgi:hypothetical protein
VMAYRLAAGACACACCAYWSEERRRCPARLPAAPIPDAGELLGSGRGALWAVCFWSFRRIGLVVGMTEAVRSTTERWVYLISEEPGYL